MSESPLLIKMDALMKKHRGSGEADATTTVTPSPAVPLATPVAAPPPGAWLPVLTDVIERGALKPAAPPQSAAQPTPRPGTATAPTAAAAAEPSKTPAAAPVVDEALAKELLNELAPRLSEAMEKQVAAELRKNIDQTVSSLLGQLDVNVRAIVRDAVAEKLKQPRDPSS
ncbi:MAG: hypothetical protein ACM3KD_01105 [Hyphomicrobiaceae bacterium]